MSKGPITGWQSGEYVITTKPVPAPARSETLREGVVLKLDRLYRLQEGLEVWGVFLGGSHAIYVAPHTSLRRLEATAITQ